MDSSRARHGLVLGVARWWTRLWRQLQAGSADHGMADPPWTEFIRSANEEHEDGGAPSGQDGDEPILLIRRKH